MRVPVRVIQTNAVPPGAAAWVPKKRTILVRPQHARNKRLMAHELQHVRQAEKAAWPLAYVIQWMRSGFSYTNMPYEVEARAAETQPHMLQWADEVIKGLP